MASLNVVVLVGNLTRDPELRFTQSGTARTRFDLAINRTWTDREGNRQEETTFVPVVVWGSQAEACANYLKKGRTVAVQGRLRIYKFTGDDDQTRKVTEVVADTVQFLGGPRKSQEEGESIGDSTQEFEDEVPF